jgi:aminomethyltransferase
MDVSLIAVQGPRAIDVVTAFCREDVSKLKYYTFATGEVCGRPATISRTGYTGEDGFELYIANADAEPVWDALVEQGRDRRLKLCGLGARDCLRLEAGFSLYGQEIREDTNPIEAGLGWVVKLKKGEFIGRDAIAEVKEQGPVRTIAGIEMIEKAVPRQGYAVFCEGNRVGEVTSGTFSPTLGKMIAMAYVRPDLAAPGTRLEVEIRGRMHRAQTTALPFYKRPT